MNEKPKFIKINANGNKPCVIPISAICCITDDSFSSRLTIVLTNGHKVECKYTLDDFLDKVKDDVDIVDLIVE